MTNKKVRSSFSFVDVVVLGSPGKYEFYNFIMGLYLYHNISAHKLSLDWLKNIC